MLEEPKSLQIPTVGDFYYDGDVDEKWAIDHYLGKDIDFTEKRYYTFNPLSISQDFNLVGAKAYRYYIFGAFRYLQSNYSKGEPDVYAALPESILGKIDENADAFTPLKNYLIKFCKWAITNHSKFDVNKYSDIYGDVRAKYKELSIKVHDNVPD